MLTGGVALMYVTSADDSNGHDQRWALSAGLTGAGAATLGAGLFAVGASGTQRQARTLGAILLPLGFASATGGFLGLFASTADQAPRAALRTEISAAMLASSALFLGGGTIALAVDGQRQRTLQASTHGPRFAGASLAPTAGGVMGHIGVEF
jgi:hypothetical protein